jgi:hypothetical protein
VVDRNSKETKISLSEDEMLIQCGECLQVTSAGLLVATPHGEQATKKRFLEFDGKFRLFSSSGIGERGARSWTRHVSSVCGQRSRVSSRSSQGSDAQPSAAKRRFLQGAKPPRKLVSFCSKEKQSDETTKFMFVCRCLLLPCDGKTIRRLHRFWELRSNSITNGR